MENDLSIDDQDDISFLWYDKDENIDDIKSNLKNKINYTINFYTNLEICIDNIESIQRKMKRVFFITSTSYLNDIISKIHNLRQIDSIFLMSKEYFDIEEKYSKIIGIFTQYDDLINSIQQNIDVLKNDLQSFSIYTQNKKSTHNISKESASFLWFILFKNVILALSQDKQAKQDMINKLKERYQNNNRQLKLIEHFDKTFRIEDSIKWYTRQQFIYKTINRSLRTKNINELYGYRYFIGSLSKNLSDQYNLIKDYGAKLILYHGVHLSNNEIDKLKTNEGNLISMNGFLSTTLSKSVALKFTGISNENRHRVLFEIECDTDLIESVILASIDEYSHILDEQDILFDLGATFEILSVIKYNNLYLIKIKATDEGTKIIKEYIELNRQEMITTSTVILWGILLIEMDQYDNAIKYFNYLLSNAKEKNISEIYINLGLAYLKLGKIDDAIKNYHSAYDLIKRKNGSKINNHSILAYLGTTYRLNGNYEIALSFFNKYIEDLSTNQNLNILKKQNYSPALINIANIYFNMSDYDRALEMYLKSLEINIDTFSIETLQTVRNINNISTILMKQGKFHLVLEAFFHTLKVFEKCLLPTHQDIARLFINIGLTFDSVKKYDDALIYYKKALYIQKILFPIGHQDVAVTLNHMGMTFTKKCDYKNAYEVFLQALTMREEFLSFNHPDRIISLLNFGNLYLVQKNYTEAIVYYTKALDIQEKIFSHEHHIIFSTLVLIGDTYYDDDQVNDSLVYYKKALDLQKNLSNIAINQVLSIKINMGNIFLEQDNYNEAVIFYLQGFNINEKLVKLVIYNICNNFDMLSTIWKQQDKMELAFDFKQRSLKLKEKCLFDKIFRESIITDGNTVLNKEDAENEIKRRKYIITMSFRKQPIGSIMTVFVLKSFMFRFLNIK
ncbi:unnamed protein product [Rotaria sp. Silwood2]|nr:unnamed protein product [Rotaria sp. Silwood2]CAF4327940.1 unnamed protein product [Rotaria sp. Silwood2]